MYGSDSDRDIDEFVLNQDTPFMHEIEYGEEGEDEMEEMEEDQSEEGEFELDEYNSETMEFGQKEMKSPGIQSRGSRMKSNTKVNEEMMGDEHINSSVESGVDDSFMDETPMSKASSSKVKEFEMVNLKKKREAAESYVGKEFQPVGKINQTAKKREKRKLKK